jgi:hypothetical protein
MVLSQLPVIKLQDKPSTQDAASEIEDFTTSIYPVYQTVIVAQVRHFLAAFVSCPSASDLISEAGFGLAPYC